MCRARCLEGRAQTCAGRTVRDTPLYETGQLTAGTKLEFGGDSRPGC